MFESDTDTKDASKEYPMWDPKLKLAVQKLKDKTPPTNLKYLEAKMASYKHERDIYSNMPQQKIAFFFSISFKHVINTFKIQAQSWVDRYGSVLKDIAMKDLEAIQKTIQEYDDKMAENPNNIE